MDSVELGLPYRASDWEHGLTCAECPHAFREGDRFTTRLYAFSDDVPMALVVCLPCASGGFLPDIARGHPELPV